jgi:hypothetical protein
MFSVIKRVGLSALLTAGISIPQAESAQEGVTGGAAGDAGSDPMPPADEYTAVMGDTGSGSSQTPEAKTSMFDTDRGVLLVDTDGDGFPDLTESIEMTNPLDANDYPGSDAPDEAADPGFPATSCRSGYRQAGSRLCISPNVHNAKTYANAIVYCRDRRGRVASYGDLRYLYVRTSLDAAYNPNGRWIGNFVDDDKALCGNRSITVNNDPDIGNFEGECNRFGNRNFWCAHDRY